MSKSFTLLELLVVITIICVLSSIVVVSLSGSTESATAANGKSYAQQVHALLGHETVLDLNFNESILNSCSDGSDACDSSGYGNHGVFYGNTSFEASSIDGYAAYLDGSGDYIACGKIKDIGETTLVMWFNSSDPKAHNGVIDFRPDLSYGHFDFNHDSDRPLLYLNNANYRYFSSSVTGYMDGNWHFLALYIKGSGQNDITEASLSIDAEAIAVQSTSAGNAPLAWTGFDIGRMSYGTFHGFLDDVRVYSASLSSAEIRRQYILGLKKLLAKQVITQAEYIQRIERYL